LLRFGSAWAGPRRAPGARARLARGADLATMSGLFGLGRASSKAKAGPGAGRPAPVALSPPLLPLQLPASAPAALAEPPALMILQAQPEPRSRVMEGVTAITDVQSYKDVRASIVRQVDAGVTLQMADFKQLFIDLRRTQDFARHVSLSDKLKQEFRDFASNGEAGASTGEQVWDALRAQGLIIEADDDAFIKLMIYRQALRGEAGFQPPSFADVRQWIGMLFERTLRSMQEEVRMIKSSKPRTRSELFLRLYLLAKISGLAVEFYHTDIRSGGAGVV
jgi:hypothetical protein